MIRLQANKSTLAVRGEQKLVSGSVGIYSVQFLFSPDWDGLDRTASFTAGNISRSVVLDDTNICCIPWEVLERPGGKLRVGVVGTNGGEVVRPTIMADLGTIYPGATMPEEPSREPTPGVYEQILSAANQAVVIAESVREDADRGAFDGEDGFSPAVSVSEITGGHRVTITDETGTQSFDVMDGQGGTGEGSGTPGQDGFSPTVTVAAIDGGHRVIVTDLNGEKYFDVMDGKDGAPGQQGIPGTQGEPGKDGYTPVKGVDYFDGIQGPKGDKGDKGDTGEQGIQGIPGPQGIQGEKGDTGAAGLQGPKGDTGSAGPQGIQGLTGPKGDPGADGKTPVRGTDYWTEEDKAEIVEEAAAAVSSGSAVPGYVAAEAEGCVDRILAAQGARTFTMAAITDLHYGNAGYTDGIKHACQALKYIDSRVKLDAVVTLGDYTDGYPASGLDNALGDAKAINALMDGLRFAPNLRLQGNHDYYADHSPITRRLIQAYSDDVVWGDMAGSYFLRDFEAYKLRILCVNTVETDNANLCCSPQQYQWFADSLDLSGKNDAGDWQILILSHHPLDWWTDVSIQVIPKIIKCYNDGLTSSAYSGLPDFDFSSGNNQAKIVGNIHGHIHNLLTGKMYINIGYLAGGDCGSWRLSTPNACFGRENQYTGVWADSATYSKTADTAEDTAFVVYCIDLDSYTIRAVCYGAGVDRTIQYHADPVYYTVTNTLANVSTSNSAASILAGSQYTAALAADSGYELDSVTVTMGGVDITAAAYSGGMVNIASVTGDIVITAVASEAVVSVTNMIPLSVGSDGQPYNGGQGYKSGYRLNSSGAEAAASGITVTGFIPCNVGDELYLSNIDTLGASDYGYAAFYNSDFSVLFSAKIKGLASVNNTSAGHVADFDSDGNLTCVTPTAQWMTYMKKTVTGSHIYARISAKGIDASSVITVNQPIG